MSRCRWLLIPALLFLASCQERTTKPQPLPKVVYVEVDKYVPLDPELTKDCPIAEPKSLSVGAAVEVARARKESLQSCNADKAAIRAAQPGTKP